jgi:virulence factor Mce-like protein
VTVLSALVLGVLALALVLGFGGGEHTLRAAFQSAVQIVPGQEVRIAGRKVGTVDSIAESDGEAIVQLKIGDSDWPLHRGTMARLRYGSLGGYAARFVELDPGPASAPALPDGGALTSADTITPVEFDQIFNTYDKPTRKNLAGTLQNTANTFGPHGDDLGRGLTLGGPALDKVSNFMADVGADRAALDRLVRAGASATAALHSRDAQLRSLIDAAASTFSELAAHARAQQATLDRFPAALTSGQDTLRRLDTSLTGLSGLMTDLAPGAKQLRALAPTAYSATATLHQLAPLVTRTLDAGTGSVPDIGRLLKTGASFMPLLGKNLKQLAPMFGCMRPYAPELAGQWSTWLSMTGSSDTNGGYVRGMPVVTPPPEFQAGSHLDSVQLTNLYKDRVFYARPRPPGLNVGQPWFIPQCDITQAALDPSKDPENQG